MTKSDPIIAVKQVATSSKWYQELFDCKSIHGGDEFDVLVDEKGTVLLCLHVWGAHDHPSMMDPDKKPGNGLILYFRTTELDAIRANAERMKVIIDSDVQLNPNSRKKEFSLYDPDGYYLSISEYHEYKG